jgi:hypothetical protein
MSPFTCPPQGVTGPGPIAGHHHTAGCWAGRQPWAHRKGSTVFGRKKKADNDLTFRQLWDRERSRAMTPSERAEIDAIFARYA